MRGGGGGRAKKVVNIQGSSHPSSGELHPNKYKARQKCQEVCVYEQVASVQTQTQKGGIQRVEARMGNLRGIQKCCPRISGQIQFQLGFSFPNSRERCGMKTARMARLGKWADSKRSSVTSSSSTKRSGKSCTWRGTTLGTSTCCGPPRWKAAWQERTSGSCWTPS